MTCARRPAGARKPAPSTSAGSRRPDTRTGRARARLSLLPVLSLLVGALSPFAATSANAQTTIWSATLTVDQHTGIDTEFGCASSSTQLANCDAALTTDRFSYEGNSFYVDRIQYKSDIDRLGIHFGEVGFGSSWRLLTLHIGGKSFSLANGQVTLASGVWQFSNELLSWADGQQVQVRLTYMPPPPPAAPTNLGVGAGSGQLDLTWTAPSSLVTGYDVHYTSVLHRGVVPDTWPALDNPLGNKPVAGWVPLSRSGTATSHTISSLLPGTAYRVRVRARNSAGAGDWVFGTGTTSGTAPVPPSATFTVDEGAGFVGCSNDSASTLANCNFPPFTLEGTKYTITSLTSYTSVSPNELLLVVSPTLSRSDWEKLTLYIDGNSFRPVDSIDFGNALTGITWRNPGFRWAEGQQVKVRLTDDPPTVSLSASPNPVDEGSPVTVTATLSQALSEDVRIPVYSAAAGSFDITIPAGQTTVTHEFTAPQLEDGEMKQYQIAIEWWRVLKSTPLDIKGSQSIAGVTVLDRNADPHTVSVSDASGTEMANGYPRLCFAFTLNRAAPHRIWVGYRTENGTATAGQDYQGVVGSPVIPFEPGETRKRKCISILDDNVEDSGETFSMVLVNPDGAILGRARGIGTIYNHEPTSLSALAAEGASGEDGPFAALDIGAFAPATTAYAVAVPHGTTHVRLRPTAADEDLTLSAGSGTELTRVRSGESGPAVALEVGDNVLVVRTTAGTGVEETYRVTVTRWAAQQPEAQQQSTEPLTAAFEGVPSEHDGAESFTLDVRFSEALGETAKVPAEASFAVQGGNVKGVRKVGPGLWRVSIAPKSWREVRVTLAGGQDCDVAGAVCTTDGRPLSNTLTASVASPTVPEGEAAGEEEEGKRKYGPSPTASGPDGETLLVGFGQIAQTPPKVSIALDGASTISEGDMARFRLTADPAPSAPITVAVAINDSGEFVSSGQPNPRMVTIGEAGTADFSVATQDDDMDEPDGAITATVTPGTVYTVSDNTAEAEVEVRDNDAPVAAPPTEEKRAWQIRFGRSVSQQVVDALQQRFSSTTTPSGLQLTVAGETLTSDTPLEENHVLLSRLLGFERVSSQEVAQGSSFSFSPEGAGPRLSFWGQGAFSSFNGVEESITLTGEVTTALVGAEWSNERWRAGAALSHSWGNGSYQGEADGADGRISSSLTGVFPYGRYALTPRLGVWATAGYGWGNITLNPDGDAPEYNPATTMALGAVGMDGLLLDGGREGITLTTTADALFLKTTSEAVEGLASSEGTISRLRLGLEATRPFPLANGASLSPSLEVGLRQDSGDAETGFGMDLGAGLSWNDPERGITATVKGRTLLSHGAEHFQDQGLALSFSWQPTPSNRGASLSLSHAVGLPAEGGMAALLNPTAIEVLDEPHSSGERFEARLAYGFPFYNNRLTLTPAVATALSPSSRTYSLLWSLTPHDEHLVGEPWQLSLEGERHENLSSPTVDHSLKLRFALPL